MRLPSFSDASTTSTRKPSAVSRSDQPVGVGVVVVADRQQAHLDRRQPRREGAGVVLEQHAEEALDRAEQGAVDHDRALARAVGADVLQAEALRLVEVHLDGRQLPLAADGVTDLDVDLRAVEGAAALVDLVGQAARASSAGPQRLGGVLPVLVGADRLARRVAVDRLASKSSKPNARSTLSTKPSRLADLVDDLLAVQKMWLSSCVKPRMRMRPCSVPRALVAVHRAELEQPQRQLAVGALRGSGTPGCASGSSSASGSTSPLSSSIGGYMASA